jgi:outer membrane protein TolC
MKRVRNLFAMTLVLSSALPAAEILTLKQAQAMMFIKNIELNMARQEYCQKDYELNEAKSAWYPLLDLFGSYNYQNKKNTIEFPAGSPLSRASGRQEMGINERADMGIELTYPVTSAIINIFNVKYRQSALLAKSAQDMALKNQLSLKLGTLYFLWELSYGQMNVKKMVVAQFEATMANLKNMEAGGLSFASKVLEAQAGLENARAQLVAEENKVDSLKLELLNIVQVQDSAQVPEAYGFAVENSAMGVVDTLKLDIYRPELAAIDVGIDQLTTYNDVLTGRKYPNLMFIAGYHYGRPELQMSNDPDYMGYAIAGLQVRFNLFDGNKITSQQQQTQQQIEIARNRKQQAIDDYTNAITSAKMQYFRAKRQKNAALISREASSAVVKDVKNSVDAGIMTPLDYQNALVSQATADLSVKQAEFMEKTALLKVYYAIGKEIRF